MDCGQRTRICPLKYPQRFSNGKSYLNTCLEISVQLQISFFLYVKFLSNQTENKLIKNSLISDLATTKQALNFQPKEI